MLFSSQRVAKPTGDHVMCVTCKCLRNTQSYLLIA